MMNGAFAAKGSAGAERRAYARVTVALPAFLDVGGERLSVRIVDLSAGGAKLECSTSPAAGASVTLHCGTFHQAGRIRWSAGGALGISFDGQLDEIEVGALVDRSNALDAWRSARHR